MSSLTPGLSIAAEQAALKFFTVSAEEIPAMSCAGMFILITARSNWALTRAHSLSKPLPGVAKPNEPTVNMSGGGGGLVGADGRKRGAFSTRGLRGTIVGSRQMKKSKGSGLASSAIRWLT